MPETVRKPAILLVFTALLRIGLGLFFLIVALRKIPQLDITADFLTRSRILPEYFSLPLACIGVGMELTIGVCFVLRIAYRAASIWGSVMTSIFLLLYVQGWVRGLELSCNCLGNQHEVINYPMDSGLRLLLLGAVLILVWDSRQPERSLWKFRKLDFSDF